MEIDGEPHLTDEGHERDRIRDEYLGQHGYAVLRVLGYEVIREDGNAHERIWDFVKSSLEHEGRGDEVVPLSRTVQSLRMSSLRRRHEASKEVKEDTKSLS